MAEGSAFHYLRKNGLIFLGIFVILYTIYSFSTPLLDHYFAWLADTVRRILSPFDSAVSAAGNVILYGGSPALRVVEGCDGITVFVLIVAAILAFQRPLKARFVGILIFVPVLFIINLGRLVVLSAIRFYYPEHFAWVHVYLFQPVMIFVTFACFVIWAIFSE